MMINNSWLGIVKNGLPPITGNPKHVIIVGAGMAGLTAAYELKRAGYQITILEAQNRVGGRIETIREPFDDGLYGEVGAMRIPRNHKLTMNYIEKFGLKTSLFHGTVPENFYHLAGQRYLMQDVEADPSILGMNLTDPDGVSVFQLWSDFIKDAVQRIRQDTDRYWAEQIRDYGHLTFYEFLLKLFRSHDAVIDFGILSTLDNVMHTSFLEVHQFALEWQGAELCQIVGGMDSLPKAFLSELGDNIHFGAELVALDYSEDSVSVHYQDTTGLRKITGDFAIVTIPFSALNFVDMLTPFSRGKQIAIRQLNYLNLIKVLLQFENRFWEKEDGIFGGHTVTDLPILQIYYPERAHKSNRGVLIGSYNYGAEATRWTTMSEAEQVAQALRYVSKIHPQAKDAFEIGASKVWGHDRFAGGFGMYFPREHQTLFPHARTPEGAVHFAGEHTSHKHGWIEGAVESGLRAVSEIHERVMQI